MKNRQDIINAIAEKAGMTKKDTDAFLRAFQEVVTDMVAEGEIIKLVGFMTIGSKETVERKGRNPKTGEEIVIPAHKKPFVKIGKEFKDKVAGK